MSSASRCEVDQARPVGHAGVGGRHGLRPTPGGTRCDCGSCEAGRPGLRTVFRGAVRAVCELAAPSAWVAPRRCGIAGVHQRLARTRSGVVEHHGSWRRGRGVHADLLPVPRCDRRQRPAASRRAARLQRLADLAGSSRGSNRCHHEGDPVLQSPQSDWSRVRRRGNRRGRRCRRSPRPARDHRRDLGRAGSSRG